MNWDQACAYWDRGAISTADLTRVAHDLFEGEALADVPHDIVMADPAAQAYVAEWSGSPDPADPDNFWIDDATGARVSAHPVLAGAPAPLGR